MGKFKIFKSMIQAIVIMVITNRLVKLGLIMFEVGLGVLVLPMIFIILILIIFLLDIVFNEW